MVMSRLRNGIVHFRGVQKLYYTILTWRDIGNIIFTITRKNNM